MTRKQVSQQAWSTRKSNWLRFMQSYNDKAEAFGDAWKAWNAAKNTYGLSEREARMAAAYYATRMRGCYATNQ